MNFMSAVLRRMPLLESVIREPLQESKKNPVSEGTWNHCGRTDACL